MSKETKFPVVPKGEVGQRMLAMEISKAACTLIAAGETDHKKAVELATSTYMEALRYTPCLGFYLYGLSLEKAQCDSMKRNAPLESYKNALKIHWKQHLVPGVRR